jgi:hypothetical protein
VQLTAIEANRRNWIAKVQHKTFIAAMHSMQMCQLLVLKSSEKLDIAEVIKLHRMCGMLIEPEKILKTIEKYVMTHSIEITY